MKPSLLLCLKVIIIIGVIVINLYFLIVVTAMIEGPPTMPQDYFTTFSLNCIVTIATEVSDARGDVDWIHPNGTAFNSTNGTIALDSLDPMIQVVNGSAVYTHTLRVNTFKASHVGGYTCRAQINESIITRSFLVSIQGNKVFII